MKVQIEAVNHFYYPDIMISCDQRDFPLGTLRQREFRFFKKYPSLIIEILSKGTEAKDRGRKFEHYHYLETLQEYVLVSQERPQVEVFRKNETGLWVLYPFGPGDAVVLTSLGITIAIPALYEDVEFTGQVD